MAASDRADKSSREEALLRASSPPSPPARGCVTAWNGCCGPTPAV
ncbi:hypothetical protein ACFQ0M_22530 [Kitasatospora aburaviensis]